MGYRCADFSFNTQPPEGGWARNLGCKYKPFRFQHTAARRRLGKEKEKPPNITLFRFQHTAARRRLDCRNVQRPPGNRFNTQPPEGGWDELANQWKEVACFNTQPPEGGCLLSMLLKNLSMSCFNTQPPEGGWLSAISYQNIRTLFQHTAARRRLADRRRLPAPYRSFNTQPPEGGWACEQI